MNKLHLVIAGLGIALAGCRPAPPPATLPPLPPDAPETVTTSGLIYAQISPGQGQPPQPGQVVVIDYVAAFEDGTLFDTAEARGGLYAFRLGQDQAIPGWEEGLLLMRPGETARLIIPPALAYGNQGVGEAVPPSATLTYDITLIEVRDDGPTGWIGSAGVLWQPLP